MTAIDKEHYHYQYNCHSHIVINWRGHYGNKKNRSTSHYGIVKWIYTATNIHNGEQFSGTKTEVCKFTGMSVKSSLSTYTKNGNLYAKTWRFTEQLNSML